MIDTSRKHQQEGTVINLLGTRHKTLLSGLDFSVVSAAQHI